MRTPKLARQDLLDRVSRAIETGRYRILPHARLRCNERRVSAPDIEAALQAGRYIPRRNRYDERHRDWSYCFEGASVDGDPLRVVVAFADCMLVVTVVLPGPGDGEG